MKRAFDLCCSVAGLALLFPVIVFLSILVRFNSRGPAIFSQIRVGRAGEPFVCYKLRTMRSGAANVPTHLAAAAEVTSLGKFLRKTKLDELPQLLNVAKGDMSLVGPRPSLPSQIELIDARRKFGVLDVRPGITGLAQARGIDMSTLEKLVEADAEYVRDHGFTYDLGIILRTVVGILAGKKSSSAGSA